MRTRTISVWPLRHAIYNAEEPLRDTFGPGKFKQACCITTTKSPELHARKRHGISYAPHGEGALILMVGTAWVELEGVELVGPDILCECSTQIECSLADNFNLI